MNALSIIGDKQNSTLLAVRSSLNQMVEPIRLLLPDPFNRFDTTGLFVFGFLLISICLHMFNVLMSTNSGIEFLNKKKKANYRLKTIFNLINNKNLISYSQTKHKLIILKIKFYFWKKKWIKNC